MQYLFILMSLLLPGEIVYALQSKEVTIDKTLLAKIVALAPNESNAQEVENIIGPPSACIPLAPLPRELWVCQWKGDLASNQIRDTVSVTFEAGMISSILGVNKNGDFLVGERGKPIKVIS